MIGRRALLAVGLVLGACPFESSAEVRVAAPVRATAGREDRAHVEPTLAAHPRDPKRLVGAAVTFQGERSTVLTFRSDDGGKSWRADLLAGCSIDPWVRFDADGIAYLACLAEGSSPTLVFRLADGGKSWHDPVEVPPGEGGGAPDRPVLAVAPGAESGGGSRIFLAQGQGFPDAAGDSRLYGPAIAVSDDGGRSFGAPWFLRHDNLHQQPIDAATLADGSVAVLFMDYLTAGRRLVTHRRTWMTRSADGGQSWSSPQLVREQLDSEMPVAMAVDPRPGGCGRIYLVMDGFWKREPATREQIAGSSLGGLLLSTSDDCGVTWSEAAPIVATPEPSNQEIPVVAVNRQGVVGVAWYDTRHSDSDLCFDVYFAASFDGGATFEPEVRLTDRPSCPRESAHPGAGRRWAFGGDYSGLAAAADGSFHALWADTRTGVYQIWSARIEAGPAASEGVR